MKFGLLGLSVALAAALAAACGGTDQNSVNMGGHGGEGTGANTGAGTTTGGGGNTGGGSNTGGSGGLGGASNTGGSGGLGGASNTGGLGGAGGESMSGGPCGDVGSMPCERTEYCDYTADTCGGAMASCVPKPEVCPGVEKPTCGCDGQVYSNPCAAALAGVDVSLLGGCPAPEGMFPCGAGFCDQANSYCEVQLSDVVGDPNVYSCHNLPPSCDPSGATCACLADQACGDMCEEADGGLTLTCP